MKKIFLLIVCGLCLFCCSKEPAEGVEKFSGKFSGSCEYVSSDGRSYHNVTVNVKVSSSGIKVNTVSGIALPTLNYNINQEYDTMIGGYFNDSRGYSSVNVYKSSLYLEYWPKNGDRYTLNLDKD